MSRLSTRSAPRNRLLALRMRDGHRWTLTYRERAWDVAVEEARRRSFFSSLVYAVTMMGAWRSRPGLPGLPGERP